MAQDEKPTKKYRSNKKSLTHETVQHYFDKTCPKGGYPAHLFGYEHATRDLAAELNRILKKSKDFETLKSELTKYHQERLDFLHYISGGGFQWGADP